MYHLNPHEENYHPKHQKNDFLLAAMIPCICFNNLLEKGKNTMTTITKKINLNVSQPNNYQLVHAMQGDSNTVEILATIWDGNKMYAIDCDQISLEWQSPSGSKRDYPVVEHTQHTATFLLKKEMLVENGDYAFCIRFDNSDNDVLRTFPSTMRVIRAPFGQLMDSQVVTITEFINASKNHCLLAESFAHGGTNMRQDEDIDNAKAYFEQTKELFASINRAVLTGTLLSGENVLTFQNAEIIEDATYDIYVSQFGVSPINVNISTGKMILVFKALPSDLHVRIIIN